MLVGSSLYSIAVKKKMSILPVHLKGTTGTMQGSTNRFRVQAGI